MFSFSCDIQVRFSVAHLLCEDAWRPGDICIFTLAPPMGHDASNRVVDAIKITGVSDAFQCYLIIDGRDTMFWGCGLYLDDLFT